MKSRSTRETDHDYCTTGSRTMGLKQGHSPKKLQEVFLFLSAFVLLFTLTFNFIYKEIYSQSVHNN